MRKPRKLPCTQFLFYHKMMTKEIAKSVKEAPIMEQQGTGRICPRGASYYLWREGDTLAAVARSNGTTVQALRLLNPDVDFSAIAVGDEICMPSRSLTCQSGQPYTVRRGDTFYTIAQRYGISDLELAERNPDVSPTDLMVGDVICVPAESQGGSTPTPSQPSQPSTPTVSCPTGYAARRVQRGQTYADLLIDLNVSYQALRNANPTLRPGFLVAGTSFCAPPAGSRTACVGNRTYVVQDGDNLNSIARRLGTTNGRMLMLNPTLLPTDFSQAGTTICIP